MTAPTTLTESTTTTGADQASATTATSYEEAPTLRLCTAGSVVDCL